VSEPVDLSELVQDLSGILRASVSAKIALHLKLDPNLPPVEADSRQLQQVLMNLTRNAAEAIEDNAGTIEIGTGVRALDEHYIRDELGQWEVQPGEYVYLEVRDTGCGMDDAVKAKIFDPFFTTKFLGRGLGLAAVAGIARGHGAAIKVSSAPGRGSSFLVLFRPSGRPAIARQPERGTAGDLAGTGAILFVDDEPLLRQLGKEALEPYGYEVLAAGSGPDAIEIFKKESSRVSLIVLDLDMPGMDGREVLATLREIRPEIAVIVSSGHSQAEVLDLLAGTRISTFLQKPYTSAQLAGKVKSALAAPERTGGAG
jgi:CheY-like chemotaxis protein